MPPALLLLAAWLALPHALAPAPSAVLAAVEHRSAGNEEREYAVKAAFLLHFIRYTTWPAECFEDDRSPIVVTVVGKDPFGELLESTFRGEEAHGRKIVVARAKNVPDKVSGHVVFCGELSAAAREELLARCAARPVLLVGETRDFAQAGACVNFYLHDKKTRFEINPDAVSAARLELSPAVLKLAKIVRSKREEGRDGG